MPPRAAPRRPGDRHGPRGYPGVPDGKLRIPESLIPRYLQLKGLLGAGAGPAAVFQFLFTTAAPRIDQMAREAAARQAPADVIPEEGDLLVEEPVEGGRAEGGVRVDEEYMADQSVLRALGVQQDHPQEEEDNIADSQLPRSPIQDSQPPDLPPEEVPIVVEEDLPTYGFVALAKLRELFQNFSIHCPHHGCDQPFSEPRVRSIHQTWSLRFRCQHGHTYGWSSTEMELYHHIPAITHRQYHAALSAGLGYTQLDSICKEMGLAAISKDHFFAFQRGRDRRVGWIRATLDQWALKKDEVQNAVLTRNLPDLNGDPIGGALVLYADLRYDSTRNGYNGTAAWIDGFDGRVVELVNMTRVEAGNNSWRIEDMAFETGMQRLEARGILPDEIVHDDKASVDVILRRYGVTSQKDLWHWCKNIIKKFIAQVQDLKRAPVQIEEAEVYEDLELFTKRQLQEWLRAQGALTSGNKPELVRRVAERRGLVFQEGGPQVASRRYMYPELRAHGIGDKLKGWIYTCCQRHAVRTRGPDGRFLPENEDCSILVADIRNAADHWAGDHTRCRELPGVRPCCTVPDLNAIARDHYYPRGSPTHQKMISFLEKTITPSKAQFYTRARENFVNETFNSVINKYATKRTHYHKSHEARLGCCAMDWNENILREPLRIYERRPQHTIVRNRTTTRRELPERTTQWKTELRDSLFGVHEAS